MIERFKLRFGIVLIRLGWRIYMHPLSDNCVGCELEKDGTKYAIYYEKK